MPSYSFENTETNEQFDLTMRMAEREPYLQANPHIKQILTQFPGIVDPIRLGIRKPDDNFRDVLKNVKAHHPGSRKTKSTINDF
jgi:hypothetical protein